MARTPSSAASSNGTITSQARSSSASPGPPAASITPSAPTLPSVVVVPPIARTTRLAPARIAAMTSSPVPAVEARSASRSCGVISARPEASATSTSAVRPSASMAQRASTGRPSASLHGARWMRPPSAGRSTSIVPSPPSAIGHSSARTPRARRPAASAATTLRADIVPLNASGASRTVSAIDPPTLEPGRAESPAARGRPGAAGALRDTDRWCRCSCSTMLLLRLRGVRQLLQGPAAVRPPRSEYERREVDVVERSGRSELLGD